jgi:hypothetical protein
VSRDRIPCFFFLLEQRVLGLNETMLGFLIQKRLILQRDSVRHGETLIVGDCFGLSLFKKN